MTSAGGSNSEGVIFSYDTSGPGFSLLHSFAGFPADGIFPFGSLILSSGTLYGMTYEGGGSNEGVIFSISTGGGAITLIHSFSGGALDGSHPQGTLLFSSGTLYGMTSGGGTFGDGTIFSISSGGGAITVLHSFTASSNDGSNPYGSLVLSGSTLYGTTPGGGSAGDGVIFSIDTGGSNFTVQHSFNSTINDGINPYSSLTLSGKILYGMTSYGGILNDGSIFAYGIGEPVGPSNIGSTHPLSSLTQTHGSAYIGGNIITNGISGVNFSGDSSVVLVANTVIDSSAGNGPVNFGTASIDASTPGGQSLSITSGSGNALLMPLEEQILYLL